MNPPQLELDQCKGLKEGKKKKRRPVDFEGFSGGDQQNKDPSAARPSTSRPREQSSGEFRNGQHTIRRQDRQTKKLDGATATPRAQRS